MTRKSTIVLSSTLFLITLAIIFLWKEPLTISRSINDQKLTNFFLILAAIAVAPTLYFLASQLQEMQQSRLASVRPDIYPSDTRFSLEYYDHQIAGQEGVQPIPAKVHQTAESSLYITNIGIGAAKAISTQWIYEKEKVDQLALGKYSFFTPMANGDKTSLNLLKHGMESRIDLPLYYLICCGTALNLKSVNSGSDGKFGYKPDLSLRIDYLDIYNRPFTALFNVDVQAYSDLVIFKFGPPS